ncbi:MAG: FUSC family protein [Acetobacteraceae bacterium]
MWPCLLHGLRITASVTLALFVAYTLELDNAFWAGTTAAVVCQTSLGASLRKGQFRAIGTIGGGVAIVLLTAAFPQSRVGFLVGLALWCGVSGFFATILRNFAGYAAALAGYTAAIVFSDSVDAPGETFHIAITRATEIGIGVLCAGLILAVTDLGDARRRLGSALGTVANGIASGLADTLAYGPDTPASRSARRAMIRQVVMLGATIDEALGEDSNLRPRSRTLQAAVEGLYSALSAWRGVANHLDARPEEAKRWEVAALQRAMSDASGQGWVDAPEAMRQACGAQVRHVLATPAADASARFLVDRVADALLALRRAANGLVLVAAPGHERPDEGSMRLYVPDILPAIVNAIRIIVTLLAVELVWIGTNWQGGQTMVSFTALTVILFSPRATEVYACVVCFAIGTVAAAALAAIVTFAVLPAQTYPLPRPIFCSGLRPRAAWGHFRRAMAEAVLRRHGDELHVDFLHRPTNPSTTRANS